MHFDPTRRSALKQSGIALASSVAGLVPRELSGQSNKASTPQYRSFGCANLWRDR